VWAGTLSSGNSEQVILALNYGGETISNIAIPWSGIPTLKQRSGGYRVRDVWAAKDLGVFKTGITLANVTSHQTKVFVLS